MKNTYSEIIGFIVAGMGIIAASPNGQKNIIKAEAQKRLAEQEKENKIKVEMQKLQTV